MPVQATATNVTIRLPIYQAVEGQRDGTVPLDITGYTDAVVAIQAPDGTVTTIAMGSLTVSQRPYANAVGDTLQTWLIEFRPTHSTFLLQGVYLLEAGVKMPDGTYAKSRKVKVNVERSIVTMTGEGS